MYSEEQNTCIQCYDFYYTIDYLTCEPLPYPLSITNFNNDYLIFNFSQPVTYNQGRIEDLIEISIDGPFAPYNFSWEIPYWPRG